MELLTLRPVLALQDVPLPMRSRITVNPKSGCWLGAPLDRDGYARWGNGNLHRALWLECVGPIEPGYQLDHREDWGCLSRACALPDHLNPCTARENNLRGNSVAAVNARKVECDHGHPFSDMNTYIDPDGSRNCRTCNRAAVARYKTRQRGLVTLAAAA